jgi:uncharacterized protein (DUF952 family)
MSWVFKVVPRAVLEAWDERAPWGGSAADQRDGFIHLSAGDQIAGTLAKHYAEQDHLVLLWLPTDALPDDQLRWEPSRGGALFPHLYGPLWRAWVARADDLPLVEGRHQLPADLPV